MKNTVLIWGGNGWIGSMFCAHFDTLSHWKFVKAQSRAENRVEVLAEIDRVKPTHLLCAIGRTYGPGFQTIDYLEQPGKLLENLRDNMYGPLNLASVSKLKNLHCVYLGTGCIFEYPEADTQLETVFTEKDSPNFFGSAYSTVKGYMDKIMTEQYADSCLNLRIRMPISAIDCPRNFLTKIFKYSKICSIPNSMTVLEDFIPRIVNFMERQITGTVNCVNPGVIDHDTILKLYKNLQSPEHSWELVDENNLLKTSSIVAKRSNNHLATTLIESYSLTKIPTILESVTRILTNNPFISQQIKVVPTVIRVGSFGSDGPPYDEGLSLSQHLHPFGKICLEEGKATEFYPFTPRTLKEMLPDKGWSVTRHSEEYRMERNDGYHTVGLGAWRAVIFNHLVNLSKDGEIVVIHCCNLSKYPGFVNFAQQLRPYAEAAVSLTQETGGFYMPMYRKNGMFTKISMFEKYCNNDYNGLLNIAHAPAGRGRLIIAKVSPKIRAFAKLFELECMKVEGLSPLPPVGESSCNFSHHCAEQSLLNVLAYTHGLFPLPWANTWVDKLSTVGDSQDSGAQAVIAYAKTL
jgi:3,5-epimerase/4-reductase